MADISYSKRRGDRREGRLLRSLPAYDRAMPYLQRRRSESVCSLSESLEVTAIEQWLREKRSEGWTQLGFLHLIAAAYVRTVSMRPGVNRFVCARRIFARNEIQLILRVKRSASAEATSTHVKIAFSPSDTVFDVQQRISAAVDDVRADVVISEPERIADRALRLPRPLLRLVTLACRVMDYFDWLPRRWLDASPWHGSLEVVDLGSLGIVPADIPLSDFGTLSASLSFGAMRKVREPDGMRHYVDYRLCADRRIADSYYFASALKCMKYFLKNPALLELPPEKVEDDVN